MSEPRLTPVWVLVARSCRDCNCQAVQAFAAEPTEEQRQALKEVLGGMWCINVSCFPLAIGGEAQDQQIYED